ncbi:MAG: hypothetical protein JWO58_490 [Chitinophagaceae bacterium]|nr:hypothetical protein [Chitinophagaceae bacterium]
MKIVYTCLLCVVFFANAFGQKESKAEEKKDTLTHEKFITMVNFNRDQSYITFSQGFGNLEPLIFEGKLSPSYFLSNKGRRWALMANPQVQIRMLNKESYPIRVPSYRLYLTFFRGIDFWNRGILKNFLYDDALWFVSVAHHSNGQEGNTYDSTGHLDIDRGNFATNFIQFGLASYSSLPMGHTYNSLRQIKVHMEIHPTAFPVDWYDDDLKGQYGFYRLFVTYSLLGIRRKENINWMTNFLRHSSFEIQTGWIFDDLRGYDAVDVEHRLIVDMNYKYYPDWISEFAFFVRYYYGQDYYNIHYETQLSVLSFGLTSNIVKMNDAIKYIGRKKKDKSIISTSP